MKANKEKIIALIQLNKSNEEIAKICSVSIRTVQRYKRQTTNDSDTKNDKRQATKIKKEMAKVLIEEGHTLQETAKKIEKPLGTVGRWSSEENLQQSQLENLKSFRDEYRKEIRKNKLKRLALNNKSLNKLAYEIDSTETTSKADFEKIKLSEEIEQLIFECDRIERLEKTVKEESGENKVLEFLNVLQGALKDE